jgi:hypothetical protein
MAQVASLTGFVETPWKRASAANGDTLAQLRNKTSRVNQQIRFSLESRLSSIAERRRDPAGNKLS